MIKAICFDFDGTLAHFTGDFSQRLRDGAAALGIPEKLQEKFGKAYLKHDKTCRTTVEATRATFEELNQPLPENFEELCQQNLESYCSQMELLSGAIVLLEYLQFKEIPLALITNGPEDVQTAAIQRLAVKDYFKTILISGEVGARKPDAKIFELAAERLDVAAKDCLMIGDKLDADIEGAQGVGMQTLWISSEKHDKVKSFSSLQTLRRWLDEQLS
ncbi:MAG: HAD family hydrolase [Trueperaceae bacterium]